MNTFRTTVLAALGVLLGSLSTTPAFAAHVNVIELDNEIISPVTQQYIEDAVDRSETDGSVCLVLLLDTPGGLLESTRAIVKRLMNAKVPVVVYVAPGGARAGSAGVFLTLAAHVAAMAPSTNIGAAHPVILGERGRSWKDLVEQFKGGKTPPVPEEALDPTSQKVMNDALAWVRAIAQERGRNV